MHHLVADIVLGVLFGALMICAVAVVVAVVMQYRRLAGRRESDEWRRFRQRLSRADRRNVVWATARQRPVDRADLAQAQMACARQRQVAAERAPYVHGSGLRLLFPAFYGVGALWYISLAVTEHGSQRALFAVVAAIFMATGILWAIAMPRSLRRQAERMAQLRRRIEDRYAG